MALTTTTRQTPSGISLENGFLSKIAFERDPNISFWEKTIKPIGLDTGDAIETTTMHNTRWRTKAARRLITGTDVTGKAAYDPNVINDIIALCGYEGAITIHFPDGTTTSFYGFLKSVEFDELAEGTHPELTYTIVPTNTDPVTGAETAPVTTSVTGT